MSLVIGPALGNFYRRNKEYSWFNQCDSVYLTHCRIKHRLLRQSISLFIRQCVKEFNKTLQLCDGANDRCPLAYQASHVTLKILSPILNIIHMIILSKLQGLRKMQSIYILYQNLALADILLALCAIIRSFCWITTILLDKHILITIIPQIIFEWILVTKYPLICLAAYDRLVAICKPFYDSSDPVTKA